jgi:autotransporter-associated beta strand protein
LWSLIAVAPSDALAAFREWSGGAFGGGQFTEPGSWFNGVPTNNTTSDVGVFYGFFGGPFNSAVNLSASRSVRGLQFAPPINGGAAVNFTFSGQAFTLGDSGITIESGAGSTQTINNDVGLAGAQTWSLGRNLRVNGELSGTDLLIKSGASSLTLATSNSHSGVLRIQEGTILVTGAGRLSDKTDVDVLDGATLRLDGMTDAINGLYGHGIVVLQDGATLVIGNSINDSQGVGSFFGSIQGTGGRLIKRGPGTFSLRGENTYTGGTRVESGRLLIGSATGPGGVTVLSSGSIGGSGFAEGTITIHAGGTLSPGGDGVGTPDKTDLLNSLGVTFDLGALFQVDLGGTVPGETHDTLQVGSASIAGSLEVNLVDGFTPSYGQVFQVLVATSSLTGTFTGLPQGALVGEFGDVDLTIDYTGDGGRIVSLQAGLPGDFNGSAIVDAADYVLWRKNPGGIYTPGDYNTWRANFGRTAGSDAAFNSTNVPIPEPTTVVLLVILAFAGVSTKTRSRARATIPVRDQGQTVLIDHNSDRARWLHYSSHHGHAAD